MKYYDKIIIGAGFYGLYSALFCGLKGQNILVLECESSPFKRATYINQARVHQGYHYPRSLSTAMRSAEYFERFNKDFSFCINKEFQKIYAISKEYSWSNGMQFKKFCKAAGIPCEEIFPGRFFKDGMCDSAFLTREYTYDALILKKYLLEKLSMLGNVEIQYNVHIYSIIKLHDVYELETEEHIQYQTEFLLNTTYASVNQILEKAGYKKFDIKYELCEIILCSVNKNLKNYGITVMDGPFFSIMPFGKTGFHSLTSVTFTPHAVSYADLPIFSCQKQSWGGCFAEYLGNCNECCAKPETSFPYMEKLAQKYLNDFYQFSYHGSLFSMKPILMSSEVNDSRPTIIRTHSKRPTCISVLSGKINTIYDMDEVLNNE